MDYFGNPRHTQSMIAYINLTEYIWWWWSDETDISGGRHTKDVEAMMYQY